MHQPSNSRRHHPHAPPPPRPSPTPQVEARLRQLEGKMLAWVPPPPGNCLFFSFLHAPRLAMGLGDDHQGEVLQEHAAVLDSRVRLQMPGTSSGTLSPK